MRSDRKIGGFRLDDWQEPQTLEEAEKRRDELKSSTQLIQLDLSDKNRTVDGRRLADEEYWTWNRQAKMALMARLEELRRIKQWISNHVRQKEPTVGHPANPIAAARRGLHFLIRYVASLESKVKELEDEIDRLRGNSGAA